MTKITFEITDPHALAKQYPQFVTFEPKVDRRKVHKALELGLVLDGVTVVDGAGRPDVSDETVSADPHSEADQAERSEMPGFLGRGAKNVTV